MTFAANTGAVASYTWTFPTADAQGVMTSDGAGAITMTRPATPFAFCSGTATSTATLFLFDAGATTVACTDTTELLSIPVASAGTIRNLRVKSGTAGFAAGSGVMTLRKNAVDTTITCTVGTGTTCSDTTHNFTVVAGDLISLKMVTVGTETLANVRASWEKE
jgi:hypothetical protein